GQDMHNMHDMHHTGRDRPNMSYTPHATASPIMQERERSLATAPAAARLAPAIPLAGLRGFEPANVVLAS
ncbi:MAG: hypothetical protein WA183_05990, partial [Chthoniobacterales bacterium]